MVKAKTVCAGNVSFVREDGKQVLRIDMLPVLEKLFVNSETETSEKYLDPSGQGVEYYTLSDKLKSYMDKYNSMTSGQYVTLQKFGTDLFFENKINLSVLRSVDISSGVEIVTDDLIIREDCKRWIEYLAGFLKFLYTNFVENITVKATIEFEI